MADITLQMFDMGTLKRATNESFTGVVSSKDVYVLSKQALLTTSTEKRQRKILFKAVQLSERALQSQRLLVAGEAAEVMATSRSYNACLEMVCGRPFCVFYLISLTSTVVFPVQTLTWLRILLYLIIRCYNVFIFILLSEDTR